MYLLIETDADVRGDADLAILRLSAKYADLLVRRHDIVRRMIKSDTSLHSLIFRDDSACDGLYVYRSKEVRDKYPETDFLDRSKITTKTVAPGSGDYDGVWVINEHKPDPGVPYPEGPYCHVAADGIQLRIVYESGHSAITSEIPIAVFQHAIETQATAETKKKVILPFSQ